MKNETLLMWILGVVVLLFLFGGFGMMGFSGYGYGGMMSMMYGFYGPVMMLFGWLYGILLIATFVLLIIWLFKQVQK